MLQPDIKPGEVVYRFRVICDADKEFAFIETWLYIGYVKRKSNSFDCDNPYWYYRFKNLTEMPITVEDASIDFPSWKQLENMFVIDDLVGELSFFCQGLQGGIGDMGG